MIPVLLLASFPTASSYGEVCGEGVGKAGWLEAVQSWGQNEVGAILYGSKEREQWKRCRTPVSPEEGWFEAAQAKGRRGRGGMLLDFGMDGRGEEGWGREVEANSNETAWRVEFAARNELRAARALGGKEVGCATKAMAEEECYGRGGSSKSCCEAASSAATWEAIALTLRAAEVVHGDFCSDSSESGEGGAEQVWLGNETGMEGVTRHLKTLFRGGDSKAAALSVLGSFVRSVCDARNGECPHLCRAEKEGGACSKETEEVRAASLSPVPPEKWC